MPTEHHRRRRARLLEALSSGPAGRGVAIVPAATLQRRSNDTHFPFHQDPDFRYLTGFPEPDAVAVLRPGHEHPYTPFVNPRDPTAEIWNGRRAGVDGARERYGADAAHPIGELEKALPDLLRGHEALHHRPGLRPALDRMLQDTLETLRARTRDGVMVPSAVVDLGALLHEHRLVKAPEEIEAMRRAARVSAAGHDAAMRFTRPGVNEADVQAVLEYVFRRAGAQGVGYDSIVAGGANACILHYTENDAELRDGDLLLIDAGAEVDGYSGDVTRTFPVSGKWSPAQRRVYAVVLEAQRQSIEAVRPGARFVDYHDVAVRVLTEGLVDLGLLEGAVDDLIESEAYKRFYMHRTGHWLGMDVHDVGRYHEAENLTRKLEPGMVLTVEPGLYIAEDDEGVPADYRGIGIRIEDDVLVTPEGRDVLSEGSPKDPGAIEARMAEPLELPG
jgi:Xaa-Pro aminopeptidase